MHIRRMRYSQKEISKRHNQEVTRFDIALPLGLRLARMGFDRSKQPIKVGAALVAGGIMIIAHNQRKSAPILVKYKYQFIDSMHAETSLFAHLDKPPKNMVVYTFRATKAGRLAIARPCDSCMQLLKDQHVKKIVYTIDNGWATEKI